MQRSPKERMMPSDTFKRWIGTPWILPPAVGILAAAALEPPLPVAAALVGIPLLICWVPLRRYAKAKLAEQAARLGLTYSFRDPFKMVRSLEMPLFRRGGGARVHRVWHGEWSGMQVRAFQFNGSEDSDRYMCAMAAVDADCPPLYVGGQELDRDSAKRAGVSKVETELERFNRSKVVYARDRLFATAFVDQRFMEWLLPQSNAWGLETASGWLMCWVWLDRVDRLKWEQPEHILEVLRDAVDHVPRAALSMYPPS